MFFLSGSEDMKRVMMDEFLSVRKTHTLVLFRDEKDVPVMKTGINLYAPYFECSFGFDPALDMLAASPTVNEAARAFSEAIVTDRDILSSRDPIWSYNARSLLSSLFIGGVEFWKFLHRETDGSGGEDFPSLSDTIFGMVDDLASAKMKGGESSSRPSANFPQWWNLIPDEEQEFIRTTVLAAPLNTAGSLLAVINSYIGTIARLYSGDKCPLLFNPEWPENIYVYLPAINAQMLDILLRTARVAWGNELSVVACGISSWGKRFISILGDFCEETGLTEENFLMLGTSPSAETLSWYSGDMGWGEKISSAALTLFRRKVEETTGNPNGLLTSLHIETPERCSGGEWLKLSEAGWTVETVSREAVKEMASRRHVLLRPESGGQSQEVKKLRRIFGDGNTSAPFRTSEDGTVFISAGAGDMDASMPKDYNPSEENGKTGENSINPELLEFMEMAELDFDPDDEIEIDGESEKGTDTENGSEDKKKEI
jgi:hypothetical protein